MTKTETALDQRQVIPNSDDPEVAASLHAGSWFSQMSGKVYDKFFQDPKHKKEFDAWQAAEDEKQRVANSFRDLTASIDAGRTQLDILKSTVALFGDCDVALSIFRAWRAGSQPLANICDTFTRCEILRAHGPAVIKLAASEQAALEKRLEDLKAENKALLRELGLI